MRFPKKSLIRDSAVDFCVSKIAATANQVFAAQKKTVRLSTPPQTKTDHQKDGTDYNDTCEGGYAAPRRIATADAVPAIRCLLATSRSEKVSFSAVSANQVFAAQKAARLSALAPNINRYPFGCLKDVNGEGGYGAFPNFPNAAGV